MRQGYQSSFFFIFLLLCFSQLAQAQTNFISAKLVRTPGDTVNGFLNYYDWPISPDKIEFKQSLDGNFEIFKAAEVKSFYIPSINKWYQAKPIHFDFYLKRVNENTGRVAKSVSGTFFLSEIFQGNLLSLYMMMDEEQNTRFFLQKDSVLSELINYEYTSVKNGKVYYNRINQYITQLQSTLNDCDALKINNSLSYSEKALSRLLTEYHVCKGKKVNRKEKVDKPIISPIVTPGLMYATRLNTFMQTFGVGIKIGLPRQFYNRYTMVQLDQYRYNYIEEGSIQKGNHYLATILFGTYMGKSKIQPFVHGGVQFPTKGTLTVGAGISYAKKVDLEIRFPSMSGIMATFHYTFGKTTRKTM